MLSRPLNKAADSYEHTQVEPLAAWSITHNLNRPVTVTIYDDDGNLVASAVRILNSRELAIVNTAPATGRAVIK